MHQLNPQLHTILTQTITSLTHAKAFHIPPQAFTAATALLVLTQLPTPRSTPSTVTTVRTNASMRHMYGVCVSRLTMVCANDAVRHKIQSGSFVYGWACPVPMVMEMGLGNDVVKEGEEMQQLVVLIQDPSQLDTIKHGEVLIGMVMKEGIGMGKESARRYELTMRQYGVQESVMEGYGYGEKVVGWLKGRSAVLRPEMEYVWDMFGEHVSFADVLDGNIGEAECDQLAEMRRILELLNQLESGDDGVLLEMLETQGMHTMDMHQKEQHITF